MSNIIPKITCSETSKYIALLYYQSNDIYVQESSDFGVTFTSHQVSTTADQNDNSALPSIKISADGRYQVIGSQPNSNNTGNIWVSSNYGVTWTAKFASGSLKNWLDVSIDTNGKYIIAINDASEIWLSNNYGVTFTLASYSYSFVQCQIVDNGNNIYAIDSTNKLYTSNNGGISFALLTSNVSQFTRMSSDQKYIVYIDSSDNIQVSNNYGLTYYNNFNQSNLFANAVSFKISKNGENQIILLNNNTCVVSIDFGKTWIVQSDLPLSSGQLELSYSGDFIAIISGNNLYVAKNPYYLKYGLVLGSSKGVNPIEGEIRYNTGNYLLEYYNGTSWQSSGTGPTGPTGLDGPTGPIGNAGTTLTEAFCVAGGGSGSTQILAYSYDGLTWYESASGNSLFSGGAVYGVAWNGSLWIAVGYNTDKTICIANSPDGINWISSTTNPFNGEQASGIAWNGSYWVALGANTDSTVCIATSRDGMNWTPSINNPFSGGNANTSGIAWNESYWVAVGYNGDNTVCITTSYDGMTWINSANNPFSGGIGFGISWNGSMWVAVGGYGSLVCIATSYDGLNWTPSTNNPFSGGLGFGIEWNGSMWVAVGYNTDNTVCIATSYDGMNWTNSSNNPFDGGEASGISWNGSLWIAVGVDGSSTVYIATSIDGMTWTNSPSTVFTTRGFIVASRRVLPYIGTKTSGNFQAGPTGATLNVGAIGDYFIDTKQRQLKKFEGAVNQISTFVSGFNSPAFMCVDASNNIYIADSANHVIKRITPAKTITIVAGTLGVQGFSGDGGAATSAKLYNPYSVTIDSSGNLYICDSYNNCIRMVNTSGIISTIGGDISGGDPVSGFNGDGPALSTKLHAPSDICIDNTGNLYFVDFNNSIIRKL
jgi:hypothetical protein